MSLQPDPHLMSQTCRYQASCHPMSAPVTCPRHTPVGGGTTPRLQTAPLQKTARVCSRHLTAVLLSLVILLINGAFVRAENELYEEEDLPIAAISESEFATLNRLEILPQEFTLDTSRRRLQLVVIGHFSDGTADLTRNVQFHIANPALAGMTQQASAFPISDGKTEIVATAGEHSASM